MLDFPAKQNLVDNRVTGYTKIACELQKNETIGRVNVDPQDRWIFYAKHSLSGDQCARKILIFIICKIDFA